jgi:predicted Zn-dependent protease
VEDDRFNAMAYPGGHIIVFTGLFNAVSSENELASVLGHEMGHYANRDHLRGLGRALILTSVSVLVFGPDSRVNNFLLELLNLTNLSFSRKQELWADEYALMRLQCLYGHVGGATDFLIKIPKAQDPGRFGHYFSTHPENRRRIERVKTLIRQKGLRNGPKSPLSF